MKKSLLSFVVLVALAVMALGASTALAAPPTASSPGAGLAKPLWTEGNSYWRSREWIEYDRKSPAYEPYDCDGPYGNGHGVTQWACFGTMVYSFIGNKYWQVNIDAYGEQTYWNDSESPLG